MEGEDTSLGTRMLNATHYLAALAACAALSACTAKTEKATGPDAQPVASIDGKTITLADLKAVEAGEPKPTNPQAEVALHKAALDNIVSRSLMARAAEADKLDTTPSVQRDSVWATEGVKAAAEAKKVMAEVQPPSQATIDKFIADNPRAFRDRKFLVVDQDVVMSSMPALPSPQPHTLEAYQAVLDKAGVAYERRLDLVDSGAADPKILENLLSMPKDGVFQVNNGRGVTINQIRDVRPSPLTGAGAVATARNYLTNKAAEAAAKDYLDGLRSAAHGKIRYEPGYDPPST
jgi:hypothetical protein